MEKFKGAKIKWFVYKQTLRTAQNMQNNERYQTFRVVDYDYWNIVWKYNYTPDKTKQNIQFKF